KTYLQTMIRQPYFVPDSRGAAELLQDLKKKKIHMAIVIDEYGGTAGVITIEDLIEEIVGNISDEHDDDEFEAIQLDQDTYLINGTLHLHDVEKIINVDFPTDEFDTLSGFLIGQLGDIPNGEQHIQAIEYQDHLFTVEEADNKRITKIKVSQNSPLIPLTEIDTNEKVVQKV